MRTLVLGLLLLSPSARAQQALSVFTDQCSDFAGLAAVRKIDAAQKAWVDQFRVSRQDVDAYVGLCSQYAAKTTQTGSQGVTPQMLSDAGQKTIDDLHALEPLAKAVKDQSDAIVPGLKKPSIGGASCAIEILQKLGKNQAATDALSKRANDEVAKCKDVKQGDDVGGAYDPNNCFSGDQPPPGRACGISGCTQVSPGRWCVKRIVAPAGREQPSEPPREFPRDKDGKVILHPGCAPGVVCRSF